MHGTPLSRGFVACLLMLLVTSAAAEEARDLRPEALAGDDATFADRLAMALRRYERADYSFAAAEFQALYVLRPDPNLLYNAAQAFLSLNRYREAERLFQRFLHEQPALDRATRVEVEAQLARCQQPTPLALPAPPASRLAPSPPPVQRSRRPLWIGLGIAGGLGATAAVTGGLALKAASDLHGTPYVAPVSAELAQQQQRVRVFSITTDVLLAVGGAALLGGVIGYTASGHRKAESTSVMVLPTVGGAIVVGSF